MNTTMKLERLVIGLQPIYSDNAGKYQAEVEFENDKGKVKMILDTRVSEALLLCIGEVIIKFSAQAAIEIQNCVIQSVKEARKTPVIEQV